MKRAHRRAHLIMWWILVPVILVGLALAFNARRTLPPGSADGFGVNALPSDNPTPTDPQ